MQKVQEVNLQEVENSYKKSEKDKRSTKIILVHTYDILFLESLEGCSMSYMGNCEEYLQTAKSNADDLIEVIFLILFHSLTLAPL